MLLFILISLRNISILYKKIQNFTVLNLFNFLKKVVNTIQKLKSQVQILNDNVKKEKDKSDKLNQQVSDLEINNKKSQQKKESLSSLCALF